MSGPVVYWAEEADNGKNLHLKCLVPSGYVEVGGMEIGGRVVKALFAEGKQVKERGERERCRCGCGRMMVKGWGQL